MCHVDMFGSSLPFIRSVKQKCTSDHTSVSQAFLLLKLAQLKRFNIIHKYVFKMQLFDSYNQCIFMFWNDFV